jgi:predicted enzyme related to lactoylglutathione lyase
MIKVAVSIMMCAALASAAPAAAEPASSAVIAQSTSVGLAGRPLQQVAVTTTDLARAVTFYGDTLGLPLMFVANNMAFFDVAGMRLMVALDRNRETARPATILYFDAPDFDATVARLRAANVNLEGPVETVQSTVEGDLKLQQFVDPDGNALAVMGLVASE